MPSKVQPAGSLKTRITLFTLVIFMTSLWSLTFYASHMLREDMQRQLSDQQFSVVSFIARAIDAHLNERIKALETIANSIDPEAMEQPAALQQLLNSRPLLQTLFSGGVLITDSRGTAIAEVPPSLGRIGVNFMDRKAVAVALQEGHAQIGTPVMDKRLAVPVIGIAAPIRDATGRNVGTLAGVIALRKTGFLDELTQSAYGKTGSYFLVDRQERLIIASTKTERILQPLLPRGHIPAIDRFVDGFEGSQIYTNPKGIEVLNSVKRLTAVDWGVSASIAATEAFAPILAMQHRMVMAALLLTVLAGALTWWLLRRELSRLSDTAQTLAQMSSLTQLPQPLPVERHDEIGLLIQSFNHLLSGIAQQKSDLEKQLRLFSAFIDALPNPIFIKDTHTVFTACNRAYEEAFGIARADFIGKTVLELDFLPLAAREAFQAADKALIAQGGQTTEEIDLAFCDGVMRTVLYQRCTFDLVPGQDGGMLGLIVDISQRKHIEEALKVREAQYRLLAENAHDVIWTLDVQGHFTYVSPSVAKLRGYTSAEVMQQSLQEALMPEGVPVVLDALHKSQAASQAGLPIPELRAELEQPCKDGSTVWTEVTTNGVQNANGEFLGLLGITRDISERKERDDYRHFHGRILEMLAGGTELDPILQAIVLGIEALHPDKVCSILLLDDTGKHVARCIAPSLPDFYNTALHGLAVGMGMGSCGTAAFTGERVVVEDIATHPYWAPFKELAAQVGLGACWSQPIRSGSNRILGAFGIYHRHQYHPSDADITLIEQAARLASISIEKTMAEEQIRNLAYLDSLTRLPNRRLLDDRLTLALTSSRRTGLHGALMLLDLDNFKPLNDTHGHATGDLLLIEVARRLSASIREVDTVARLGGDEFVVVIGDLDADAKVALAQALAVAEKIRYALALPYLLTVAPQPNTPATTIEHHCSCSMGLTLFTGQDAQRQTELLKQADDAMYRAKQSGRNTIHL